MNRFKELCENAWGKFDTYAYKECRQELVHYCVQNVNHGKDIVDHFDQLFEADLLRRRAMLFDVIHLIIKDSVVKSGTARNDKFVAAVEPHVYKWVTLGLPKVRSMDATKNFSIVERVVKEWRNKKYFKGAKVANAQKYIDSYKPLLQPITNDRYPPLPSSSHPPHPHSHAILPLPISPPFSPPHTPFRAD